MSKPVIAVDCDEVLCYFIEKLVEFHNNIYSSSLVVEDFTHFDTHLVWGGTRDEANKKFAHFYETVYFKEIVPVKNAYETLKKLKEHFSFVVVTARDHHLFEPTKFFLETHYPEIFDHILLGNHYGHGKKHSKQELCQKAGAILLIDDNIGYINECTKHGIKGIVFGDYPWNLKPQIEDPSVIRVSGWEHIDHEVIHKVIKKE